MVLEIITKIIHSFHSRMVLNPHGVYTMMGPSVIIVGIYIIDAIGSHIIIVNVYISCEMG